MAIVGIIGLTRPGKSDAEAEADENFGLEATLASSTQHPCQWVGGMFSRRSVDDIQPTIDA